MNETPITVPSTIYQVIDTTYDTKVLMTTTNRNDAWLEYEFILVANRDRLAFGGERLEFRIVEHAVIIDPSEAIKIS